MPRFNTHDGFALWRNSNRKPVNVLWPQQGIFHVQLIPGQDRRTQTRRDRRTRYTDKNNMSVYLSGFCPLIPKLFVRLTPPFCAVLRLIFAADTFAGRQPRGKCASKMSVYLGSKSSAIELGETTSDDLSQGQRIPAVSRRQWRTPDDATTANKISRKSRACNWTLNRSQTSSY
jgi:hypothetical protein